MSAAAPAGRQLGPRPLLDRLAGGVTSGELPAAAVFVDLAGFTSTTEALAEHGDHGAEVLADLMRVVFGPLLAAVHAHGGYVAAWSGDAVMAVFEEEPARGLAAAEAMAAAIADGIEHATPYGSFVIRGRVGAGAGTVRWRILRSPDGRRAAHWVHGTATARAVEAEARAGTGRLVVDESLAGVEPPPPSAPPAPPAGTHPLAALLYPPEVQSARPEFRPIATAFVGIADPGELDAVLADVFDLQDRYGGRLSSVEISDKGCVVLLVWGAPVAYEGDVERMLEFLLELRSRHPGTLRAGVAYGVAFTGFVGSEHQEDYGVYGRRINLAARLMGAAGPGAIYVDDAVAARAGTGVEVVALGPRELKGFAAPVPVAAVEARATPAADGSGRVLVGRGDELAAVTASLDPLSQGRGAAVLITGEAGVGKSRLAEELRTRTAATWLVARCDPVWRPALAPFHSAIRGHFGIPPGVLGDGDVRRFEAAVAARPALEAHRPFLSALAQVGEPGPVYEAAAPPARFRGVLDAIVALLGDLAGGGPVVVQLDDLHWADPETAAFLPELRATLADDPVALVATSREGGVLPDAVTIELDSLGADEIGAMAAALLGDPLAPDAVAWLAERTDGNPFFAEQTLLYLRESGAIESADGALRIRGESALPPTVGEVVVARLDALPAGTRRAVQTAAVIGANLAEDVLERVFGPEAGPACADAAGRGVLDRRPGRRVRFRHALVRDAAYGTLLRADRAALHSATADALETLYAGSLEPHLRDLARHHWYGGQPLRALEDGRGAADHALRGGAYREAVATAEEGLERAGELPTGDERARAELALSLALGAGRIVTAGQAAPETRAAYERALELSEHLPEDRRRFQAMFGLRTHHQFAGHVEESDRLADECLALARRLGAGDLLMQAHLMVGNRHFWAGELGPASEHLGEVLRLARPDQHAAHVAGFAQNPRFTAVIPAALTAWLRGDGAGARRLAEEALEEAAAIGHRFSEALVLQAAGFLHALDGRGEQARAAAEELCTIAREERFPIYMAIGSVQLGWARSRLGDPDAGLRLLQETVAAMRRRGMTFGQTLVAVLLSDAALHAGRREEGRAAADAAIAAARETGERVWLSELLRLRALLDDDPERRRGGLDEAEQAARAAGAVAVVERVRHSRTSTEGDDRHAQEARRASAP